MKRFAAALLALAGSWIVAAVAQAQPGGQVVVSPGGGTTVGGGGATVTQPGRLAHTPLSPTPPLTQDPFRLAFFYSHVVSESGDLAIKDQSSSAVGLDFAFRDGRAIRKHLQIAHQWESQPLVTRKGFRLDLIDLGFPVPVVTRAVYVEIEPILRVIRGEILWESIDGAKSRLQYRLSSGFGAQVVVGYDPWFLCVEPLSVDFRYAVGNSDDGRSGFATVWSVLVMGGRVF